MNFKLYITNILCLRSVKDFIKNQYGVAAIEFALILPLLVALLFGSVELYGHLNAVRKIGNLTASLADLVSQHDKISTSQLNALHPLVVTLMAPLDPSSIRYRIASIHQGSAGQKPQLLWEHINGTKNGAGKIIVGGSEYKATQCNKFNNPLNKVFPPNQSSIFVVVDYRYESVLSRFTGGIGNYSDNIIAIPRNSSKVKLSDRTECSVLAFR